jgi:hypothetical protein
MLFFKKERIFKIITISLLGVLLLWMLTWYALLGIGSVFDKALNEPEAMEAATLYIKNDSLIKSKTGIIEKLENVSFSISNEKGAVYEFKIYGSNSKIDVEVLLSYKERWVVDTLIIE